MGFPILVRWYINIELVPICLTVNYQWLPPWWRHQMEIFFASMAICTGNSPASGEFPAQRPVTRSFDVFFDLCLNKGLRKQSWGWWFETVSCLLWRHCNVDTKKQMAIKMDRTPVNNSLFTWWRHQMEKISALLVRCGEFPQKGQWRGALMFSLICAGTNGAHYDVTLMKLQRGGDLGELGIIVH